MKKVIARYFYSPICTESFASLDRLRRLFNTMKEHVHFEAFNTIKDHFDSAFPWFTNEKELLATLEGTGNKPLTYSKLFIEGNEIKGFPPSKKMIGQILQAYDINFQQEAYQTYYKQTNHDSWDISVDKLKVRKYEKKLLKDVCLVCTKYNPFLEIGDYMKENWNEYEALKESYLEEKLQEEKMIGFIAYYEEQPVGFIEAFPLKLAAKLGFPISDVNLNGIMITCLNIRKEVSGNGIASKLVKEISNEAGNRNYQSIEVLAFPDKSNWQPISLYQAQGYTSVKTLEDLSLMRKDF
ncbi:GNAT family N-acetyltransferase [Alkaliphilus transvaalensis]|uniref:GNAT family N-acetyltransferase n=1 Tax=Alkaliphilus transvaalensis TaxID=114628 RepID=UPI0004790288|nr:GNAT family N-acetyltransferase [Alkaliphilus transvaalensis]